MTPLRLSLGCALLLLAAACQKQTPLPTPVATPAVVEAPKPPPAVVPKGCELNLGGSYHHSRDAKFKYQATDDGAHLAFVITPGVLAPGEKPMAMELDRTARGFVGVIKGETPTRDGKICPVEFRAEIVSCARDGVTLKTEEAYGVGEDCKRAEQGGEPDMAENLLVRDPP